MPNMLHLLPVASLEALRDAKSPLDCPQQLNLTVDESIHGQLGYSPSTHPATITTTRLHCQLKIRHMRAGVIEESDCDAWAHPLVYALARDLAKLKLPPQASVFDRAVMVYIRVLPDETPIILKPYWTR